jgi:hypothetical protein
LLTRVLLIKLKNNKLLAFIGIVEGPLDYTAALYPLSWASLEYPRAFEQFTARLSWLGLTLTDEGSPKATTGPQNATGAKGDAP